MYSQYPTYAVPSPQEEIVTLPADAYPGKQYTFAAQNGQTVTFAVPAGMGPGSEVAVSTSPQHASQPQQHPAQQQYAQQMYVQQRQVQYQYLAQQYAQQPSAQQYAASQSSETVTLPADAVPGKQYTFTSADDRSVTFSVPAGMGPGGVMTVSY